MKKTKMLLTGSLLAGCMVCAAQQINPMTQAVLNGYEEVLKENPQDYITLYQRAAQYYNLSLYERAMLDLEEALKYTPAKEKELRVSEYSLLADIYIEKGDYQKAFEAVKNALQLDNTSYPNTYKLGNICLYLNKPEEAYRAFQSLQRMQSRSQEAFFGMAKADIMMGKTTEAEEYMSEAEKMDPGNYVTYCRLGDLYHDLNQNQKAATNYLVAYSMAGANSTRPVESLVNLFNEDPAAVMEALDYTISLSEGNLELLTLKASLAFEKGDFAQAEESFKRLAGNPEGDVSTVYIYLAESQKALNKQQDAIESVEKALALDPTNVGALIAKSDVLLATDPAKALEVAEKAMSFDDQSVGALLAAGKAAAMTKDGEKALGYLNTLVMYDPSNVEALALRGYVNTELLNDSKLGMMDYTRASNGEATQYPGILYLALAKSKAGKTLDAESIILENLKKNPGNGEALYYAAVYYAQNSNLEKAADYAQKAKEAGYGNIYNLTSSDEPLNNLQPIRHLMK